MKKLLTVFFGIFCLISFADFQLLENLQNSKIWKSFGKGATQTVKGKKKILRLTNSQSDNKVPIRWRARLLKEKNFRVIPVKITFQASLTDVTKDSPTDPWGGCLVMLHGHKEGKYRQVAVMHIDKLQPGYQPYAMETEIPEKMTDLYLEFILQRACGSMTVKDITLSPQDRTAR